MPMLYCNFRHEKCYGNNLILVHYIVASKDSELKHHFLISSDNFNILVFNECFVLDFRFDLPALYAKSLAQFTYKLKLDFPSNFNTVYSLLLLGA